MIRSYMQIKAATLPWILLVLIALTGTHAVEPEQPASTSRIIMVVPFENVSRVKAMVTYDAAAASSPRGVETTVTAVDRPAVAVVNSKPADPLRQSVTVDRYSEAPRGLLEDILTRQPGVTLVERQRVDTILMEQQFSGFSDPKETVALGKMAGAQYVVTGTVQDIASREKAFNGYGVAVRNTIVTASIRVRVIEISTGTIVASTTAEGAETFTSSDFGG